MASTLLAMASNPKAFVTSSFLLLVVMASTLLAMASNPKAFVTSTSSNGLHPTSDGLQPLRGGHWGCCRTTACWHLQADGSDRCGGRRVLGLRRVEHCPKPSCLWDPDRDPISNGTYFIEICIDLSAMYLLEYRLGSVNISNVKLPTMAHMSNTFRHHTWPTTIPVKDMQES